MLYAMHTNLPSLKDIEEQEARILDDDYSKVDTAKMVSDLDIESWRPSSRRISNSIPMQNRLRIRIIISKSME